jgi:hypothetical protein
MGGHEHRSPKLNGYVSGVGKELLKELLLVVERVRFLVKPTFLLTVCLYDWKDSLRF